MAVEVKTRRWGHSLGVVSPQGTVRKLKLKSGDHVIVEFGRKENPLKELFGSVRISKPTRKILEEMRDEFESKWSEHFDRAEQAA